MIRSHNLMKSIVEKLIYLIEKKKKKEEGRAFDYIYTKIYRPYLV